MFQNDLVSPRVSKGIVDVVEDPMSLCRLTTLSLTYRVFGFSGHTGKYLCQTTGDAMYEVF